jgi:di/tricarboxylate transporter
MYLVTGLLSEVLTNNAAAALMYPIAASVGDDMGVRRGALAARGAGWFGC